MKMSRTEIESRIKQLERQMKTAKNRIQESKDYFLGIRKSLKFWREELKRTGRGIKPCTEVKFDCEVEWDVDEGEPLPDKHLDFVVSVDRLVSEDILDKGKWRINETALEDFLTDYVSDLTGFCHNGLTFEYNPVI